MTMALTKAVAMAAVQQLLLSHRVMSLSFTPSVTKVAYRTRTTRVYGAPSIQEHHAHDDDNESTRLAAQHQQHHHSSSGTTTSNEDPLLTPIPADQYCKAELPIIFAYPHCYEPHPIAALAADRLREQLQLPTSLDDFLPQNNDDEVVGKMMGVLVVRHNVHEKQDDNNNNPSQLGYLKAYSGTLPTGKMLPNDEEFCPPVYDQFEQNGFYQRGEEELNVMHNMIEQLKHDPELTRQKENLAAVEESCQARWSTAKRKQKNEKEKRNLIRQESQSTMDDKEYEVLDEQLKQEGAAIQRETKQLKSQIKREVEDAKNAVQELENHLQDLKDSHKEKSKQLQNKLFDRYNFLNALGEKKSLLPMFADTPLERPPPGAGDCAPPKLLQYAFQKGYEPIAMAEFWWGKPPTNGEVRRHDLYYPASRGMCQPILEHMLRGVDVESNPMEAAPTKEEKELELVMLYEDEYFVVVDKPEGMLSAPGRNLEYSVYSLMKERYPEATGPLLVHRLDMSTSGVLLVAKDKDIHKALAAQFIDRSVQKRYIALLDGELDKIERKGKIILPIAPDYINRPMQKVCKEGKPAQTIYNVIKIADGRTRVHFYPVTGRTHQLRVHAAHNQGLDCPIVGDDIYGRRDDRLCLHAGYLELTHPITQKRMRFTSDAPF